MKRIYYLFAIEEAFFFLLKRCRKNVLNFIQYYFLYLLVHNTLPSYGQNKEGTRSILNQYPSLSKQFS